MFSFFNQFTKFEKFIILLILIVYAHNLFLDVMAVDAAQYASISAEMAKTNSYLEVKEFGHDYLDKPPLLFWLSSLSLTFLGTSNFAYKLPSFLFLLFSLYALYRFCILYYDQKTAKNAVLILATSQSYFLMTNDVRTDAILTSCVISSCWLFSEYFEKGKIKNLLFASFFIGLAMLAKGPVGFIAILLPIGAHLLFKKKWHQIVSFKWILVFIVIAVLLFPMSYGLYHQFDLHPEKITNGVKGQGGLYFYYWLQSFGRITGENIWNNNTPWHFFIGTSAWDFFPWFFLLLFTLFYKVKSIFIQKKTPVEIISFIGFSCLFIFLSLSKYKLPHYVFITFPFAAIMVGDYLTKISHESMKKWIKVHLIFGCIILSVMAIFPILFFKENNTLVFLLLIIQVLLLLSYKKISKDPVIQIISLLIVFNIFLSFVFYPKLLTFQSDAIAAKWARKNLSSEKVYIYNKPSHLFNFYSQNSHTSLLSKEELQNCPEKIWLYVKEDDLSEIEEANCTIISKKAFKQYPVSKLQLPFLLESKRENVITYRYLIQID